MATTGSPSKMLFENLKSTLVNHLGSAAKEIVQDSSDIDTTWPVAQMQGSIATISDGENESGTPAIRETTATDEDMDAEGEVDSTAKGKGKDATDGKRSGILQSTHPIQLEEGGEPMSEESNIRRSSRISAQKPDQGPDETSVTTRLRQTTTSAKSSGGGYSWTASRGRKNGTPRNSRNEPKSPKEVDSEEEDEDESDDEGDKKLKKRLVLTLLDAAMDRPKFFNSLADSSISRSQKMSLLAKELRHLHFKVPKAEKKESRTTSEINIPRVNVSIRKF